jgi:hypothetical protein
MEKIRKQEQQRIQMQHHVEQQRAMMEGSSTPGDKGQF